MKKKKKSLDKRRRLSMPKILIIATVKEKKINMLLIDQKFILKKNIIFF